MNIFSILFLLLLGSVAGPTGGTSCSLAARVDPLRPCVCVFRCGSRGSATVRDGLSEVPEPVRVGMTDTAAYFPLLRGKRIAVLTNHTSVAAWRELGSSPSGRYAELATCGMRAEPEGQGFAMEGVSSADRDAVRGVAVRPAAAEERVHLVDLLHGCGFDVRGIFAPEHGFRGTADAGEAVEDATDGVTGIPILSLYAGRALRPSDEAMRSFDVLVVDMQDVGVRFYTYYISMLRMMDACAEFGRPVLVLDRPNPNGHLVEGPVLERKYASGVGALPIPVLHGLTMGEIARMAVGEGWCKPCELTVVKCRNYTHDTPYALPVAPSPNLPTLRAISLYPSLCLFEGTVVSVGRGTDRPFEFYGHPEMTGCTFSFVPRATAGAKHPLYEGKRCYGWDLSVLPEEETRSMGLDPVYLVEAYRNLGMGERFFTPMFEKLIGTGWVRERIVAGASAAEIRARWREESERFRTLRARYLLYD